MLRAPSARRERILVYGRSNAGKSSTWLSVLDWMVQTNATYHMYVGDTDHAWDAMSDPMYEGRVDVADLDINSYRDWLAWAKDVRAKVTADDWVIVDMIDKAWVAAQTYYWDQQGHDVLADVYAANQLAMESKGKEGSYMGGAHGANWGIINKYYNAFFQMVVNMPCHVLCVAPASEVREDEKPEVKAQFKVGWKPQGQKDLPHGFHSVLFAAETPSKWVLTTVRERGPIGRAREYVKGVEVVDFVSSYLFPIAGWKP